MERCAGAPGRSGWLTVSGPDWLAVGRELKRRLIASPLDVSVDLVIFR
jgi:hypothetical protein